MIKQIRYNFRYDRNGTIYTDGYTVGEWINWPISTSETINLQVEFINLNIADMSADILCRDEDNKRYTITQRGVHAFIDEDDN